MKKLIISFFACVIASTGAFAFDYTSVEKPKSEGLRAILTGAKLIAAQEMICAEADRDCPLGAYSYMYSADGVLNVFDFVSSFYEYDTTYTSVSETVLSRGGLRDLALFSTRALSRRPRARVVEALKGVLETSYEIGRKEGWTVYKYTVVDWMAHFNVGAIVLVDTDNGEFISLGYAPNL